MTPNLSERTVAEELELLRDAIEDLIGLPSRWSGNVVLLDNAHIIALKGKAVFAEKRWACDILINIDIIDEDVRWKTYLHGIIHSVSVGTNESDYGRFRGWEEGAVEWVQRQLRSRVLHRLGVVVPESVFSTSDRLWPLNGYLNALDVLQRGAGMNAEFFYYNLRSYAVKTNLSLNRLLF